jgi:hypothetical protein
MSRPDERLAEHDSHLLAALRHAPDADIGAPAALSDAILRAARVATRAPAAVAPGPRSRWRDGLAQAWAAFSRPPVIAGVASVVLATAVGLSVWEQPAEPTAPPMAERKVAAVPDRLPRPTGASAPAVTSIAMPTARTPAAVPAGVTPEAPGRTPVAPERAVVAEATRAHEDTAARSADQATLPAQAGNAARPPMDTARPAAAPVPPHDAEPLSLERRALERVQPDVLAGAGPAGKGAAAAKAEPAMPVAGARIAPHAPDTSADRARAQRSRTAPARSPAPTLSALAETLVAEPQRWQVRRGAEPARAASPTTVAWLLELDALAAGRWQATDVPPVEALRGMVGPEAGVIDLGWERDGVTLQRLWLAADGVRWQPAADAEGSRRFWLPLDASVALRLRASLAAALK